MVGSRKMSGRHVINRVSVGCKGSPQVVESLSSWFNKGGLPAKVNPAIGEALENAWKDEAGRKHGIHQDGCGGPCKHNGLEVVDPDGVQHVLDGHGADNPTGESSGQ